MVNLKSNIIISSDVLENSIKPAALASEAQRFQEHELFLSIERNIRGVLSSVLSDRCFK